MANTIFSVQPANKIACYNSDSDKTVLTVTAPTNWQVKLLGFSISFDGTSVVEKPVEVRLYRLTADIVGTPVAPVALGNIQETVQTSGNSDATAEPTLGTLLESYDIHPQAGYEVKYPKGEEIIIPPDGMVGITVLAAAGVNCRVKMICEE